MERMRAIYMHAKPIFLILRHGFERFSNGEALADPGNL